MDSLAPGPHFDSCLAQHLAEGIGELKSELVDITRGLSLLESDDATLSEWATSLKGTLSDSSLKLKRMQFDQASGTPATAISGIKLPKLDVPTFDGNIMNWAAFWERFDALIHSKKGVGDAEKLTYLRQAIDDGPARHVIEGLSQTAKNYGEAIKCLQERYDRPRLIHQAHVRAIIDAPSLKDGNGRELRRLHDVANQHMRAIRAMEYSPWTFVTSVLETKLDQTTMFEWQKHSQGSKRCPTTLHCWNFWIYGHEPRRIPKGNLNESSLLTRRRRRQRLDHLMRLTLTLTKRVWRVRRPTILSTLVNRFKRSRTNEKWAWSRITSYV